MTDGAGNTPGCASSPARAPRTVADLAGVPPHPVWVGRSSIGSERAVADHVLGLAASMAAHTYGERVDMLSHALQAAAAARVAGAGDALVLAALLHDLGHVLGDAGDRGLPDHAEIGARALQRWLPPDIVEPIRLHVDAKRWLVTTEPGYAAELSPASVATLAQQGGPFGSEAAERFAAQPHGHDAVRLRRWDDAGKVAGFDVTPLEGYRDLLLAALARR